MCHFKTRFSPHAMYNKTENYKCFPSQNISHDFWERFNTGEGNIIIFTDFILQFYRRLLIFFYYAIC